MDPERAVGIYPDEDQPVGALGGKGQGNALLAEPGREFRIEVGSSLFGHRAENWADAVRPIGLGR